MKVFISWSGVLSMKLAEVLHEWIPNVIQQIEPYFSRKDIDKGTRWNHSIASELESSKVGLICLTPDNLESSWIMFEAGALSKNLEQSRVCPILFDVETSDVQGPLTQFQSAKFIREDIFRTMETLNEELADQKLKPARLEAQFTMWWPKLEEKVKALLANKTSKVTPPKRGQSEILEELLSLTRAISNKTLAKTTRKVHPVAVDRIVGVFNQLVTIAIRGKDRSLLEPLVTLEAPIEHLLKRVEPDHRTREMTLFFRNSFKQLMTSFTNDDTELVRIGGKQAD